MKKILWGLAIVIIASVIFIACRKSDSPAKQNSSSEFNVEAAKEWYYATFKKSPEWQNSNLKGKKLPDWKLGVIGKIKEYNIIEFSLTKGVKSFSIFSKHGDKRLTTAEKIRVAEASLSRILFIKKPDGNIIIREINYIPDWSYLGIMNFDISNASVLLNTNDFTGRVEIKEWNGKAVSVSKFIDGKRISTTFPQDKQLNNSLTTEESCVQCEYVRDCETFYNGDYIYTVCGEWRESNCVSVPCEEEPDDEDDCMMYGIGCGDSSGGDDPPACTQQSVDNIVNTATTTSLNTKDGIETTSAGANSITRNYKWKFARIETGIGTGMTFYSHENGIQNKGADGWWRWSSFTHTSTSQSGGLNPFWDASINSLQATPSINNIEIGGPVNTTVSLAGMQLEWGLKVTYSCGIFTASSYPNDITSNSWYTYEQ